MQKQNNCHAIDLLCMPTKEHTYCTERKLPFSQPAASNRTPPSAPLLMPVHLPPLKLSGPGMHYSFFWIWRHYWKAMLNFVLFAKLDFLYCKTWRLPYHYLEDLLQTAQPVLESYYTIFWGLPITGSRIQGPLQQQQQRLKSRFFSQLKPKNIVL